MSLKRRSPETDTPPTKKAKKPQPTPKSSQSKGAIPSQSSAKPIRLSSTSPAPPDSNQDPVTAPSPPQSAAVSEHSDDSDDAPEDITTSAATTAAKSAAASRSRAQEQEREERRRQRRERDARLKAQAGTKPKKRQTDSTADAATDSTKPRSRQKDETQPEDLDEDEDEETDEAGAKIPNLLPESLLNDPTLFARPPTPETDLKPSHKAKSSTKNHRTRRNKVVKLDVPDKTPKDVVKNRVRYSVLPEVSKVLPPKSGRTARNMRAQWLFQGREWARGRRSGV
ncbi:MAG: hypothetical protein Q9159_002511 [Coniocarpon cinnabarinum]